MKKESFCETVVAVLTALLIYLFVLLFFSSCKLFREVKKDSSDSTHVLKQIDRVSNTDTSKIKTETTYTRETFFYPRDTTVNNFITNPVAYIRETGSQKTEELTARFENMQRTLLDSLNSIRNSKQAITKVSVFDFWQILAVGLVALIILYFLVTKIKL